MKTTLILIDIQNEYFHGGQGPLIILIPASPPADSLLEYFRETGHSVAFVQHLSP